MTNIKLVYWLSRCKMCIRFSSEEDYLLNKDGQIEKIKSKGAKKLWIEYLNSEGVKCKEMII